MYLCREEYDTLAFAAAVKRGEVNPADQVSVNRWRERRYPISTAEARLELERRGLVVGEVALANFASAHCRKIGPVAVWHASDIDQLADEHFNKPRVRRAHEMWLRFAENMNARGRKIGG